MLCIFSTSTTTKILYFLKLWKYAIPQPLDAMTEIFYLELKYFFSSIYDKYKD